jgi:hypothetical protein
MTLIIRKLTNSILIGDVEYPLQKIVLKRIDDQISILNEDFDGYSTTNWKVFRDQNGDEFDSMDDVIAYLQQAFEPSPQTIVGTTDVNVVNEVTTLPIPYGQRVADGLEGVFPIRMLGFATNVDNVEIDVWNQNIKYPFSAASFNLSIVSSSANDTALGTGIRSVKVYYLDSNYIMKSEVLSLNGTTQVFGIPNDVYRINLVVAEEVGSGGSAQGTILIRTGGVTRSMISIGYTKSVQAIITVPEGFNAYITAFGVSSGNPTSGRFTMFKLQATMQELMSGNIYKRGLFTTLEQVTLQDNTNTIYYEVPIKVPPRTDIVVSAVSDAVNADANVTASVVGYIKPTP